MTRKLPYRRYEELKSLAADLIEDYELSYPLDPFEVAATLGMHVTVHEFGLPPAAWFCGTTDGYTTPSRTRHPRLDSSLELERQPETIHMDQNRRPDGT